MQKKCATLGGPSFLLLFSKQRTAQVELAADAAGAGARRLGPLERGRRRGGPREGRSIRIKEAIEIINRITIRFQTCQELFREFGKHLYKYS